MIAEFGLDILFTCLNKKGDKIEMTLEQLLPYSFGPCSFKPKI
jgi:cytidine deaminase